MKIRIVVCLIASCIAVVIFQTSTNAEELNGYMKEIYDKAEDLYIDISPNELDKVTPNRVMEYIADIIDIAMNSPIKLLCTVVVFSVIQRIAEIVGESRAVYSEIITVICFVSACPVILSSIEDIIAACESVQGFLLGYIPIYAGIIASSGNFAAATSYNAILLYAGEGATGAISILVKPLIMCMMAVTVVRGVNPQMPNITQSIRRLVVTLTGFIMSIFLGVIGLQGIVGRTKDSLTLKAGKYLISSFVPIIGGTLNESYRTVKAGLDSIRSVIGSFGIVVILAILIIPIIKGFVFRWIMTFGEFITSSLGGGGISEICRGLADIYLLLTTVVTLYMLMLIISTGALISLGGIAA